MSSQGEMVLIFQRRKKICMLCIIHRSLRPLVFGYMSYCSYLSMPWNLGRSAPSLILVRRLQREKCTLSGCCLSSVPQNSFSWLCLSHLCTCCHHSCCVISPFFIFAPNVHKPPFPPVPKAGGTIFFLQRQIPVVAELCNFLSSHFLTFPGVPKWGDLHISRTSQEFL